MESLVKNLADNMYDYVVIDNAPMELISTAKTIASIAHINLFTVKMRYSTNAQIDMINKTFDEGVIKNIVVCLNAVTPKDRSMNFSKYHHYYAN
jgi:hypothetical protein